MALAVTGLLGWFVYSPCLYQLSVAACRALFPWFTWPEAYWDVAARIQVAGTVAPLPFLLVVTYAAAMFLMRKIRRVDVAQAALGWRRVVSRGARIAIAIGLIPSACALAVALLLPAVSFGPGYYTTGGRHLQRGSCSHCHSPYRPFHFFRPPHQWEVTVHRMRTLEGAPIDEDQQARIAAYLSSRCSYTDAWMFRARCLQCHDRKQVTKRPRTSPEWELIVDRAARISPYAYRGDWTASIKTHAARHHSTPPPPAGSDAALALDDKLTFERKCGQCHELGLNSPSVDADTVSRMGEKVPGWIGEEEALSVGRYLGTLPTDSREFAARFPHDQPVEVAW